MQIFLLFILLNFIQLSWCQNTTNVILNEDDWDNATWILNSAFVIITMQSGFGLLESGFVNKKNRVNIMMKNVCDIIFGGLSFWMFGYAFCLGKSELSNSFIGFGDFFVEADLTRDSGWLYSKYFFHMTFATTATTIVSGALAERCKFNAYCLFSFLNTFIYSIPAHWVFDDNGWLNKMKVVDFAGAGPVHILGGCTGLMGAYILKPRNKINSKPSSYVNSILGLFMLWWGWLGFNCGSSFGITGKKWIYVSKAAITTVNSSIGGGLTGYFYCYFKLGKKYDIEIIVNCIIGALVAITPCCVSVENWSSIIIGSIGALVGTITNNLLKGTIIDDPIGCIGTHAVSGIWGLLASGLFAKYNINDGPTGLFYSGSFELLGIQLLEIITIIIYSCIMAFLLFKLVECITGLRLTPEEEELGNDYIEHTIISNRIVPIENNENDDMQNGNIQDRNPLDENPPDQNPPDENPPDENPPDENPPDQNSPNENPSNENPSNENPFDENISDQMIEDIHKINISTNKQ